MRINELIVKSREAMLSAVQIYNNPNIQFKTESFIVLSNIAWTYLMHAYYRNKGIDYRYFSYKGKRKIYDRTKNGAYKHWELERCINCDESPLDKITSANLKFLIGIRHEIEHQMTKKIDLQISAKVQACCINYDRYIKKFFGYKYTINEQLPISIQFSSIEKEQKEQLEEIKNLPQNIKSFIIDYEQDLPNEIFNSDIYAYRVIYVKKFANNRGQADQVIEFIQEDSPLTKEINKSYVIRKDVEKKKYLPSDIVKIVKEKGFSKFSINKHTEIWKEYDAKNTKKKYGVMVVKTWYWYQNWLDFVLDYCEKHKEKYC